MCKKTNRHSYGTYHYYRCVTNNKMKTGGCIKQSIRIDKIEKAVLTLLQTTVATCIEYEKLLDQINHSEGRQTQSSYLQRMLKTQQAEREKCMRAMVDLYPDWKSGFLSQEEYLTIKANLNEKIASLDEMIQNLEQTADQYAKGVDQENGFIARFRKYGTITELTRSMLVELVKEIKVHEGGRLEITLNFQDEYAQLIEYLEMNREIVQSI